MTVNGEAKLKSRQYNHDIFRELVATTIIQHDLPYSYVEYETFRETWKYLNADVKFITRNTAAADVYKFYESEKAKLKMELANLPGRISLTFDLWIAIGNVGYVCVTAHYVSSNWKLMNKIICFSGLKPPHTGFHLAMNIYETLKEWGIKKNVYTITLDNATSNDSCIEYLQDHLNLSNDLLCKGELFHVRCSAHILNLIVQDGLKVTGTSLVKSGKVSSMSQFLNLGGFCLQKCVEAVGLVVTAGLVLDVPTRWNSTYDMLNKALKYRAAFGHLRGNDRKGYKCHNEDDEWKRLQLMCDFLEPFAEITRLISGTTYPTSNMYFMQVWNIRNWLKVHELSDDDTIREMISSMQQKFDKYWEEVSDIFSMATVLDPCMKLTLAEFCYKGHDLEAKIEHLKGKLKNLFMAYENKVKPTPKVSSANENLQGLNDKTNETGNFGNYNEFFTFRRTNRVVSRKSSLEMYLEEPPLDVSSCGSLDVLKFWKENKDKYGHLAEMARDILTIPITKVAFESSFSIGSRVLNKYRSRLLPTNVQALFCSRNWLKGFAAYEKGEDEDLEIEKVEGLPSFQSIMDDTETQED